MKPPLQLPLLALAALDDAPALEVRWLPCFTDSERQRLERLARPRRRQQFIAAHALLRLAARAFGIAGVGAVVDARDELRCEVDADGRPRIAAPAGWQASLSHSGAYVAVLLERGDAPVGVDIEQMRDERDIVAIVHAACGRDAGSRDQAYRIWASHEARAKTGTAATTTTESHGAPPAAWHTVFDGHALAVAGTRSAPSAVALFDATLDHRTHRLDWTGA